MNITVHLMEVQNIEKLPQPFPQLLVNSLTTTGLLAKMRKFPHCHKMITSLPAGSTPVSRYVQPQYVTGFAKRVL